jgi:Zn-dependent protease
MRDPFFWSIPLGRLFGITIRVHLLFPVVAIAMVLRAASMKEVVPGSWIDIAILEVLFFLCVLCHEFGHCFAARWVDGDATEILMWPLGGLASVDVPHQPRAHFITAAAGPAVNLVFCLVFGLLLGFATDCGYQPAWNPLNCPIRGAPPDIQNFTEFQHNPAVTGLYDWNGNLHAVTDAWPLLLARLFWVNWALFLLNIVLVCFPMDAGRMLQSALWPQLGYRQATQVVVYSGFFFTVLVGLLSIAFNEILLFCLAVFIYVSCRTQLFILETGGEEGLFGYDFSQGYTSLERDQPRVAPRRASWWRRWLDRRAARKLLRETETREADERRLDQLLEKVQSQGMTALTDEERRFMKRVSDRYRNRH